MMFDGLWSLFRVGVLKPPGKHIKGHRKAQRKAKKVSVQWLYRRNKRRMVQLAKVEKHRRQIAKASRRRNRAA